MGNLEIDMQREMHFFSLQLPNEMYGEDGVKTRGNVH